MNELLDILQNRASFPVNQLTEPGPDNDQLADILRCALSAPDHGRLRPWRFIAIRGDARRAFSEVLGDAARRQQPPVPEQKIQRIRDKPLQAPLILVIVATQTPDHPKIPEVEQTLSAGAAAQQIQLGAIASGFGSIWLTGGSAYDSTVLQALGVAGPDKIAGFIYIGTPTADRPSRQRPALEDYLSEWHGPTL
ncbi:MAG: nitroreductase [Granulosicoccus sp.]